MAAVASSTLTAIELEPLEYPKPPPTSRVNQKPLEVLEPQHYPDHSPETLTGSAASPISKWQMAIIIGTVASVSMISSLLGGLLIVALPTMATDIGLSESLLLWPSSVNALACGCALLLSGSVADVIDARKVYLTGASLMTLTTVASGLSRTGIELILFRAAQGIALSLTLPSSVILITRNIPVGSGRNTAFACLGAAQPVGFSVGLVMGGVFVESIGWRYGYYIGAILNGAVVVISIFGVPKTQNNPPQSYSTIMKRLKSEIDWIGIGLLSTSLGMFSYILSVLASGAPNFLTPASLAIFSVAVVLLPVYAYYSLRQEKLERNVVIPPSIWNNRVFTSLCVTVFIMWGSFNAIQYFLTLFFQSVQGLDGLQTSIRFLPMVVTGTITNFLTGWLVKRTRADVLLLGATLVTSISPLLLAIVNPEWSYWTCAFFAVSCAPICIDVLFTVANLVITTVFPHKTHGLAGGVFNTLSNIGNSFGLAITAVIAASVTLSKQGNKESEAEMLMDGYRVTFWICFGGNILALAIIGLGLRKIGKVGIKED
ncbi:hypothetical protein BP5796_07172 [Coleophoma crateriformis]|uniref:Major facilitator superfamily (MFS) profile domain-containing protein n=1 Tax=Coleophoma crateriformis TaxID=565419 RepID=A0A3D8RID0_9HELO|nr:hypothetical protein BP5796_07172 [Coleophoma crateriformis]